MSLKTSISTNATVHILKTQWQLFINYCYIIENPLSAEAILIDPSWEFATITEKLMQLKATPKAILLTHHHPDHIHLADKCARYFNIPAYMSKEEIDFYGFSCTNLTPLPIHQAKFSIGNLDVNILPTPGHTKGGVCYLVENHLFTGDTLFNEGCGICHGNGACPDAMFDSLQSLLTSIPPYTLIYPGHRYYSDIPQTFEFVKEHNIYLQFKTKESFINMRMRQQKQANWFKFT